MDSTLTLYPAPDYDECKVTSVAFKKPVLMTDREWSELIRRLYGTFYNFVDEIGFNTEAFDKTVYQYTTNQ